MYWVMGIWVFGFILSALAFYFKDLRGQYVNGDELMLKFVICLIPSVNLVFGLAYFLSVSIGWCIDNFGKKCGRLIWDGDKFRWITNGKRVWDRNQERFVWVSKESVNE